MIALRRTIATDPAPERAPAGRPAARPQLTVVPTRRRAAGFAVVVSVLVAGAMLGAAVLHTTLAERQLEIDRLDSEVAEAQARFDVLRNERAELRSPTRLAQEAAALGMQPATGGEFMSVDPWTLARAIAASGEARSDDQVIRDLEPLDQFRLVKSVGEGAP